MSNKKRIQKKLSKINLNFEIKKFKIAMKILDDLMEKQNQKDKLLKLISDAVEPKGLITEEGNEMIADITGNFREESIWVMNSWLNPVFRRPPDADCKLVAILNVYFERRLKAWEG